METQLEAIRKQIVQLSKGTIGKTAPDKIAAIEKMTADFYARQYPGTEWEATATMTEDGRNVSISVAQVHRYIKVTATFKAPLNSAL